MSWRLREKGAPLKWQLLLELNLFKERAPVILLNSIF